MLHWIAETARKEGCPLCKSPPVFFRSGEDAIKRCPP